MSEKEFALLPESFRTREVSEMKVSVDAKTEQNLNVLQDILSQKLGKAASSLTAHIREGAQPRGTTQDSAIGPEDS